MTTRLKTTRIVLGIALMSVLGAGVITAEAMDGGSAGVAGLAKTVAFRGPDGGMTGTTGMPGFLAGRMLDRVEATEAQRADIYRIMAAAQADMAARRDAQRGLRDEAAVLFTQPEVDATAAEALRQKMLAQHDEGSQRLLQAALEASRVLSVEQRQTLAALMNKPGGPMHDRSHRRDAPPPAPAPQGS